MEEMRINKYISMCGICSRRKADEYIKEGIVKINGELVRDLATIVKISDVVEYNGTNIFIEKNKRYYILNKPKGYVTTAKEQFGRKSVVDLLPKKERIYPVGRLDMYSEGLLILTNDGDFTNRITHPTKHISKTYEVYLNKELKEVDILKLEKGVDIGGYVTAPAKIKKQKELVLITIYEGKNRQIRRMFESTGYLVLNLRRISIGKLKIDNLATGKYKELTKEEIEKVFE